MRPVSDLTAPMTSYDALLRVAFLMERAREGSYRVEAFRKAAGIVAQMGLDETRARVERHAISDITGIGKSTAAVINEAVRGKVPARLFTLQEEVGPLVAGGEDLYAAMRGDLHAHSNWSDGGASIDEMVDAAAALGQEWMALTDHSPRLRVANGLSAERLAHQLDVVADINSARDDGFRLVSGIEVDILDDGSLDQTDEMLDRLEIVTASVHSNLKMDRGPMTRRLVTAVSDRRVNVLGHCTGRLVAGGRGERPQSKFDPEAVFAACAENNTAVEINSRPERVDPPDEMIELAEDLGCLFAIDSDAHAPGQLDFKAYGCERAERLGVSADRIVTTWSVDDVLKWAAAE
ncbi:PHP domain-containing protein [Williamsia phyllosphaerae]|uniref:PHP domain-containing protein n=1 Tax=Williamsia phyllosphaerae TaxID=885042 RepID=UPI00166E5327|nr:PHP domain-containing protein [Williamsia phyllosphaerae]